MFLFARNIFMGLKMHRLRDMGTFTIFTGQLGIGIPPETSMGVNI